MPVPVSLADVNGKLKIGDKSALCNVLKRDVVCPSILHLEGSSSLLVDGQALVNALGKPKDLKTYGELADAFVQAILQKGQGYARIDVIFD